MKPFYSFFSDEEIIGLLCKFRIKYAKQRHKIHLLRDVSFHESTLKNFQNKHICPIELSNLLPPRRQWKRINVDERKKYTSSSKVNLESLRKTVLTTHLKIKDGVILAPKWYDNLTNFILQIQGIINLKYEYEISVPKILAIKKENTKECRKFRPISQYSLIDRIIIGQTARYLTNMFDEQLLDCSYAFRAVKKGFDVKTHHDTIDKILNFKNKHVGNEIFVAECDIKKFFDCVNHEHIKKIFEKFIHQLEPKENYDHRATIFFYQYLNSYAFNIDVYPLKDSNYFQDLGYGHGIFEWPIEDLEVHFYKDIINTIRLGVPQGGALSCLIANLLLHNVDEEVLLRSTKSDIEYLRFCDDMILLSTDENSCNAALHRYTEAIKHNFLLIHPPQYINKYNKDFFDLSISKSKKPFKWGSDKSADNTSPWVSFVGYQIKYNGAIRVRKKSIEKEVDKQEKEVIEVLKAVNANDSAHINKNSRKSLKQQVFALESRLVSMSVGRKEIFNYKITIPSLCWTNGFKRLKRQAIAKSQLRYLDSKRNHQIHMFKKRLKLLAKKTENPDKNDLTKRYFGTPFSYFGFINKSKK